MKTVNELRAEIAALQDELKIATEAENATANAEAASFVFDYDWSIAWPHPAQFRVSRKATVETVARVEQFRAKYPAYGYPPKPFEGGMTYSVLLGNDGKYYIEGSGGSVIIRANLEEDKYSTFDPQPICSEWLEELRNGSIPERMKR